MKPLILVAVLTALAVSGCGADGEPEAPTMNQIEPRVNLGLGVGTSGVHSWGGLGLSTGPVTIGVGF